MTYDPQHEQIVMFGGAANANGWLNDTWVLGVSGSWTQLKPVDVPAPRQEASAVYDGLTRTVVLFGGASGSTNGPPVPNDTWLLARS